MNFTPERVQKILKAALDLSDPAARRAMLDRECAGDPELVERIQSMIHAQDVTGGIGAVSWDSSRSTPSAGSSYLRAGYIIAGRYKLLEVLGEGGMGSVWSAEQSEPIRRKVAVKLIKWGMDSKQVLARFDAERQALAMMDHPNIARVLDGGLTSEGHPFFVMELVHGSPLTAYCDEQRLNPAKRLELFVDVCQGVQHAHQKGIVHRDLKPSNILVTTYDGRATPKIIDFGVSKAIEGKITGESIATGFGAVVGTLEYMSPEQAGLSELDIDTRADIYSLGVILYELLTGLRPIDKQRLAQAAFLEMVRLIREEDPPKPSTRLSTDEALSSHAAVRQVDPHKLMALLRGELDWVVMKCLQKDRNLRYATANGLAMDIQRYLAGDAVEARPPSFRYRARKFAWRHRVSLGAASLLLITLVGGIVGISLAMVRARAAERLATKQRIRATAVRDFLTDDLLGQANPELNPRSEQVTVEELLDRAASRLNANSKLDELPASRAELMAVLGDTYESLGRYQKALELWEQAIEENRSLHDEDSEMRSLEAQQGYGSALMGIGDFPKAEKVLREVVKQRLKVSGKEDTQTLFAINNLAISIGRQGQFAEAEAMMKDVWETRKRVFGKADKDTLQSLANYAGLLASRGDYDQGESLFREAIDGFRSINKLDSPNALACENGLARCLMDQRKFLDAKSMLVETIQRRILVLGPTHGLTLGSRTNLAIVLSELGEVDASVAESRAVHADLLAEYGKQDDETMAASNALALALRGAKRWDDAIEVGQQVLDTVQQVARPNDTRLIIYTNNLGWIYDGMGNFAEAERLYRKTLAIADESGNADFPDTFQAAQNLTRLLYKQKRFQDALDVAQLNLKARRRILPSNHPSIWATAQAVIDSQASLNLFADAERVLQDFMSTTGPWSEEHQSEMFWRLAQLRIARKNYPGAISALEQTLKLREQRFPGQWQTIEVRSLLGEALTMSGDYAQAELALSTAIQELDAALSSGNPEGLDKIRESTLLRLEALKIARDEAHAKVEK